MPAIHLGYCCLALWTIFISWCGALFIPSERLAVDYSTRLDRRDGNAAKWDLQRLSDDVNGLTGVAIVAGLPQRRLDSSAASKKTRNFVLKLDVSRTMTQVTPSLRLRLHYLFYGMLTRP